MIYRYRYVETVCEDGISINLIKFVEMKKTAKGAWVKEFKWYDKTRFVLDSRLDGSSKRYCHITKESAWQAFILRKKAHLKHATNSAERAQYALDTALKFDGPPDKDVFNKHVKLFSI